MSTFLMLQSTAPLVRSTVHTESDEVTARHSMGVNRRRVEDRTMFPFLLISPFVAACHGRNALMFLVNLVRKLTSGFEMARGFQLRRFNKKMANRIECPHWE